MNSNTKNISDARKAKIKEALQTLEDAAKDTSEEFTELLTDKYEGIKSAFTQLVDETDGASTKKIRETAKQIDSSIHENPWIYVGASAAIGLALGYILGKK